MSTPLWKRRIVWAWATIVGLGLVAILLWTFLATWRPATEDFPVQGVDMSEADVVTDWNAIAAAHADFAYLRATYGADGRDARFADYWRGAYSANLRRGAMHQYSLCRLAQDQADNFVTTVPRTSDALPMALVLDFQADCDTRPDRTVVIGEIKRFLKVVETHTGEHALLKISPEFERTYKVSEAIPRTLWLSRTFFRPDYAARGWRMWQASTMRQVEGVEGRVHWDVVVK